MPKANILITEVTDFGASLHCVAGWSGELGCMIRPEPAPGAFWSKEYVNPLRFWPGNLVQIDWQLPNPLTQYPHLTEDRVVSVNSMQMLQRLNEADFANALRQTVSLSIASIYGGNLGQAPKPFVVPGTVCPSLGSVEVPVDGVHFYANSFPGRADKLRVSLVNAGTQYDLSVTSTELGHEFKLGGANAVRGRFAGAQRLHLRIGLAREFPVGRCHAQVNGVYRAG